VKHENPEGATESGFLSRWSQRKRQAGAGEPVSDPLARDPQVPGTPQQAQAITESEPPPEKIDPRTGKPVRELTDADMPALESLDEHSDYSMFFAPRVSEGLRRLALRKLFHRPCYNRIDLCAEYAEDYTNYQPLGEVVTHDMRRALEREAERLRKALETPEGSNDRQRSAVASDRGAEPAEEPAAAGGQESRDENPERAAAAPPVPAAEEVAPGEGPGAEAERPTRT
jgi:hypothetical protein